MATTSNHSDSIGRFAISIFTINGLLIRGGDHLTRSIGQSSARWQVLGRADYALQTVAQMARDLGLARQSVQRVADVLAKEGLVMYLDNPGDRRAQLVGLTTQGREKLSAINRLNDEWSSRIMASLNAEQLDVLSSAMKDIAAVLEADIKSNGSLIDSHKEKK